MREVTQSLGQTGRPRPPLLSKTAAKREIDRGPIGKTTSAGEVILGWESGQPHKHTEVQKTLSRTVLWPVSNRNLQG